MKRRDHPNQILIDWRHPAPIHGVEGPRSNAVPPLDKTLDSVSSPSLSPLIQHLPWDFSTTFPQPTDEAIEANILDESDREPENLKGLHENYTTQCLATLQQLDKVLDARRRGVDPSTGQKPRTHASRERLRKYLAVEPVRVEHSYRILIETYENAFGLEAAKAFDKFIRARHAGIEVQAAMPPVSAPRRLSSSLPVPKPLHSAVASGVFGHDEQGKPVRPAADEVRAITENHAEKLIDLIETKRTVKNRSDEQDASSKVFAALEAYTADFGPNAARQLERHARSEIKKRGRSR